jgi:GAF domain-containing protein
LISKDQFIGFFHCDFETTSYADQDMRLAERVGNQIIGAIANVQLYAEREQRGSLRKSEER